MQNYEYKVVPAPNRGKKARGVKTPEARFANGIEGMLNEMAAQGWEFQRAEMLPSEERSGLTGTKTTWRNILVFRRALAAPGVAEPTPVAAADPTPAADATAEAAAPAATSEPDAQRIAETPRVSLPDAQHAPEPAPLTAIAGDPEAPPEAVPVPGPGARRMVADDGVEELSPVSGLTAALKARASRGKPQD
ncbi:DUF4177 domain-containing protein [Epibacterium sp. Ofav1-8]|uniref:DUF4177 domain-containing protein n=1 Tax=Epibacterium sp. Ofav1-8 TaxID=2917735 RepID=UPI001EF6F06D|nr:DUF4177 domain-containing protein [Epibacterium sp. Ofav1-8]MCG7625299.1 DUF4177 domain-containing protein [Epibacterium sp. Ofav1-8]